MARLFIASLIWADEINQLQPFFHRDPSLELVSRLEGCARCRFPA